MNVDQSDKFSMYLSVQDLFDGHIGIWSNILVLIEVKRDFDEVIQGITFHCGAEFFDEHSLEMQKDKMKRHLAGKATLIAGALQAYAVVKEDEMLQLIASLKESDIFSAREEEIAGVIGPILDEAMARQFDLNNFGISGSMIREVETSLSGYLYLTGLSNRTEKHRKNLKPDIEELFFRGDYLLSGKLDKLIIQFKGAHPEFYNEYLRIRQVQKSSALA